MEVRREVATAGRQVSWKSWIAGTGALGCLLTGCYTMQPVMGVEPQVGTRVAFDLNDAGRLALGGTIGPEIGQIEGQIIEKDSTGYLLAVTTTRFLRGGEQVWSGEHVRVKPEYLGPAYERKFSMGRSLGMGLIGAGFGAFMLTRGILGFGNGNDPTPCDTACGGTLRFGRP